MQITQGQLEDAIRRLSQGGVIVFPTETAYGLGADARDKRAVERVFAIKQRDPKKTPGLIAADFKMTQTYVTFSKHTRSLAKRLWPGALTLVLPVKDGHGLADNVVRDGTVAMRVSSHPIAKALSEGVGAPLVATSANISGQSTCYDTQCVQDQFAGGFLHPDGYLDVGTLPQRVPSTIVKEEDGQLTVLRQGEVHLTDTKNA